MFVKTFFEKHRKSINVMINIVIEPSKFNTVGKYVDIK